MRHCRAIFETLANGLRMQQISAGGNVAQDLAV